ncbi:predicted protein [Streptomyces viridochromogenes DSM 40736]|uniref:Predicted protein n=1 Tax=Streptomyces viridochromogenes (strain DSM 40736 / JCM 4977 / BCRC 1201 / Tue 494) TaxID=591159 RepID=D9WXU7_STRVT|nr:predicted protein [Streptomyces viridochromogenes DSM 40736]
MEAGLGKVRCCVRRLSVARLFAVRGGHPAHSPWPRNSGQYARVVYPAHPSAEHLTSNTFIP